MIIGFDASRAFIDKKTGTENYSFQLLKHLSLLDHTNNYQIFLRPEEKWETHGADEWQDPPWPSNFHFKTLPYPKLWTQLGLAVETFKTPLDVLFVPSHTLPIIHRPGLKTVLTVHDLGAEYLPQTHQLKQRLYLNLMTHHQLKAATHLIAVSEATKADIINKVGIPAEKISVIYEGFDEKLYKASKNDVLRNTLKQYDLQPNSYFLFVGTIQPRKNLERLITAYAKFMQAKGLQTTDYSKKTEVRSLNAESLPKLVLAGSKGWLSKEIYELPRKLDIEGQVKFLGYVPNSDLPALYSGAQAFLFPSLFEGFGIPILEAMACGCPVITSNISSMPEVTRLQKGHTERSLAKGGRVEGSPQHTAILVDPYSEESISKALISISEGDRLRSNLIKLGLQQVKKFSWEKAAKETLEILEKVNSSKK